jgi:hypothetical protein
MPMPENHTGRWMHPDAVGYGDDVYYDRYHCPHCDLRFKVEVAE